jgi:hypothetical protein
MTLNTAKKVQHTPGPWEYNWSTRPNNGPKQGWFVESSNASDYVAYGAIAELPDGRDNTEANARLIAVAPELLALLLDMREELRPGTTGGNDYHDAWEVFGGRIEAAIRKAEGQ